MSCCFPFSSSKGGTSTFQDLETHREGSTANSQAAGHQTEPPKQVGGQEDGSQQQEQPVVRGRRRGFAMIETTAPQLRLGVPGVGNFISASRRWRVGVAESLGRRRTMEDSILIEGCFQGEGDQDLFAVFDGHGGATAAEFAADNFSSFLCRSFRNNSISEYIKAEDEEVLNCLSRAFIELDREMLEQPWSDHCGTTAAVALCIGSKLFVANVGDTRIVTCKDGTAVRLTTDHKPFVEDEKERIEGLGGNVFNNRVNGVLAVSRALGDKLLHPWVSPKPTTSVLDLRTGEYRYLIIACDGFWDVFADDVAVEMVHADTDVNEAATKLVNRAFASGSTDNISVVVVDMQEKRQSFDEPSSKQNDQIECTPAHATSFDDS